MSSDSLRNFYSGDGVDDALAETRASAIQASINSSYEFNSTYIQKLEISAYAAFHGALGEDGLEGFLRAERYAEKTNGINPAWSLAFDSLSTLLENPHQGSVSAETLLFFSSVSLAAEKPNSATQILSRFNINEFEKSSSSWELLTLNRLSTALLALSKQSSVADIAYSKSKISALAEQQKTLEKAWLEDQPPRKAITLLSLYHIAQATLRTAEYMEAGFVSNEQGRNKNFEPELSQLLIRAEEFAQQSGDLDILHFIQSAGIITWKLFYNSIWRHIGGISDDLDEFIENLQADDRSRQIFSLLPSQQEAVKQALFDPSKVGIVLEMPTSSGKTLLAEFVLVQLIGQLGPEARVLYITPTRALASQVKRNLTADLRGKGIQVTSASNAFEEDPYELQLLQESSGVIISTPEKADLLMRAHAEWFEKVGLVIVDEAHLLSDGERGARLELLLTNLRKDFSNIRFLLLTPFIENARVISGWLGGDRGAPIHVSWRPSNIIVGLTEMHTPSRGKRDLWARWLEPHNIFNRHPKNTCLISGAASKDVSSTRRTIGLYSKEFSKLGSVLAMFPSSPAEAESAAEEFAETQEIISRENKSAILRAAITIARQEYGETSLLAYCLERGVAYHHAAISHELRYLIEQLVSDGDIKYIFSTSTLAQGMNFPVSTVLIHSIHKPRGGGNLTSSEFWNIAGRAGRVGLSDKGIVLFANPNHEQHWQNYCEELSKPLDSALIKAIEAINEGGDLKGLYRNTPAIRPFIQYILHSCALHGIASTRSQLAQLLEASLFNAQMPTVHAARKARALASSYIDLLEGKPESYLKLTDSTGLGSFSFDELRWKISQDEILSAGPGHIYNQGVNGMVHLISALQWLPELDLSLEISSGELNIEAISEMAWKWIQGESIESLSMSYPEEDDRQRIRKAGSYVYRKLSQMLAWGSHAYLKVLGLDSEQSTDIAGTMLPAYLQYGVNKPEAVLASVFGIPRILANAIGDEYQSRYGALAPENASNFRQLIESDSTEFWGGVRARTSLRGELSTAELISIVRNIQGM
jgi:helicase